MFRQFLMFLVKYLICLWRRLDLLGVLLNTLRLHGSGLKNEPEKNGVGIGHK